MTFDAMRVRAAALGAAACLLLVTHAVAAGVTQPPPPPGTPRADDYQVRAGGRDLFVQTVETSAFASFEAGGPVEVEVRPAVDVKHVVVRPLSLGVRPVVRGNVVSFTLPRPCYVSVEVNGDIKRPLFLFGDPPEGARPASGEPGVRYFEGGRVHEAGRIDLKSGETVYLEAGAIVRGHIVARDASRVRVLGRGMLVPTGADPKDDVRAMSFLRCRDVEVDGPLVVGSRTWTIVPQLSADVRIRNLKIVSWDFGSDGIDLVSTSHVRIERVFIKANDDNIVVKTWDGDEDYPSPANDGTGLDVSDIHVRDAVLWNLPWGNALEIGFELRAARVGDVSFEDIDVIRCERGAVMSIHNGDAATVERVRFENVRVEDARHKLIDLAVFLSRYSVDAPASEEEWRRRYLHGAWDGVLRVDPDEKAGHARHRGRIRDVVFRNVSVVDGPAPFSIVAGYDDAHAVEGVRIEALTIHGAPVASAEEGRFWIGQARDVTFVP
jgi:hypothetical protein